MVSATKIGALLAVATAAVLLRPKRRPRSAPVATHHVVILGAGFGGLQAATSLAGVPGVHLTVIDQRNHHLFQPLLYQVATAALSPDDIASPIRGILASNPAAEVLMETVTGLDPANRTVQCGARRVGYDTLIVATGSEPSYFGHKDWREAAPGLKDLDDALALRSRILGAFEQAAVAAAADRAALLTFVLVGAGPTGVEMAGAIAELAHTVLASDFHGIALPSARIVLIEAGPRVLGQFPPDLSANAAADLEALGVEIRTNTSVTAIEPGAVHLGHETLAAATTIWTAGVKATPVATWLGVKPGHGGQVPVTPGLRVPGHPDIFVIGDAALATNRRGKPFPGLAPVAKQQGHYVARTIARSLGRPHPRRRFRYRDYGTLATIGRGKAVAEFGSIHLTGRPAWLLWAGAHIFFLIGFRNRVIVSAQWAMSYITHERAGRIIT